MSELVKDLRETASHNAVWLSVQTDKKYDPENSILWKAANRIERLTAELRRYQDFERRVREWIEVTPNSMAAAQVARILPFSDSGTHTEHPNGDNQFTLLDAVNQYIKYAESGTNHITKHAWIAFQILQDVATRRSDDD